MLFRSISALKPCGGLGANGFFFGCLSHATQPSDAGMTRPTALCVGLLALLSLFFSEDKPDGFGNVLAVRPFVSLKGERLVNQSTASAMLPSWATRNHSFWLIS